MSKIPKHTLLAELYVLPLLLAPPPPCFHLCSPAQLILLFSQYILPKASLPLTKKIKLAPGAERSLTVTLKSLRNPPLEITIPSVPLSASVLWLKEEVERQKGIEVKKIRVLWEKKPVGDSKTLKDVLGEGKAAGKVEFSLMIIGGAGPAKKEEEIEPVVVGNGREVLRTEEFWADLKGFLVARLKDEAEGERIWGVFKKAVDADK
jgi:ubiquitin-like protein 4